MAAMVFIIKHLSIYLYKWSYNTPKLSVKEKEKDCETALRCKYPVTRGPSIFLDKSSSSRLILI